MRGHTDDNFCDASGEVTMRFIDSIFVHCSASTWGCALVIDDWHKARGWTGIGYHYVILNGCPYETSKYDYVLDGQIESGRAIEEIGAHARGANRRSIGVCLIGGSSSTWHPSPNQLNALTFLCKDLMRRYNLEVNDIFGHCEISDYNPAFSTKKTCPVMSMPKFRACLS